MNMQVGLFELSGFMEQSASSSLFYRHKSERYTFVGPYLSGKYDKSEFCPLGKKNVSTLVMGNC